MEITAIADATRSSLIRSIGRNVEVPSISNPPIEATAVPTRRHCSERFLETIKPFDRVVLVSHVNPDPDALASMMGLECLIRNKLPGKTIILTVDGIIARAENQAMVKLLAIPLVPVSHVNIDESTAIVMVDSQPFTGRRASEAARPHAVLDHHETPGCVEGVPFQDIRPQFGATSTIVTGYLLEQNLGVTPRLATALLYGIDSETTGYPREACSQDDGALIWLFPRADKDLLARIKNTRLPQSYFATFHHALSNAYIYEDVVYSWCGTVPQPDIIAELADFFIRFEKVTWSVCVGVFDKNLKISARVSATGLHSGEMLRHVVEGLGNAGGHDKRAGGQIVLADDSPETIAATVQDVRERLLAELEVDESSGQRLLDARPAVPQP